MDDEKTKKLLEEGARAAQKVRHLDEALKTIIQEQEVIVSFQEQLTENLRQLRAGADKIRSGCDSFNAEMEKRGIGTAPIQEAGLVPFLEQWDPKKTDFIN